ncbi:MalY/PatB family protein [Bacillus sp. 165]|uniref:MalY/PatB family protein n=1 Tax=Bacillus sp. 165 TaxID=1529117 RepID=UPI001ADA993C|nr:pyridoxal phosphate-dependent aminotransferase [Bacillus sp. 165]
MSRFNTVINRHGSNSVKWDTHNDQDMLPLWIADMDFQAPEEIKQVLQDRLNHNVYGYTYSTDSTLDAIRYWMGHQHQWSIENEWILFSAGIVPALSTAIQAFTNEGDKVLVQTPVYTPFFEMITSNKRTVVNNPLLLRDGTYHMDFDQLEQQFQQGVKLLVLCSPHNPIARVWSKEELTLLGQLCEAYDVLIVSDEIHSDIIFSGHTHFPIASLSDELSNRTITFIAPSKTFGLAGLQASAVIIKNETLRQQFTAVQHRQGFRSLNIFAALAIETAYTKCEEWLHELLGYLEENAKYAYEYINNKIPELTAHNPDGTFLLWVDCSKLNLSSEERLQLLREKGKIIVEPGEKFGQGGEGFIRINIGCPRQTLELALERLQYAVECLTTNKA